MSDTTIKIDRFGPEACLGKYIETLAQLNVNPSTGVLEGDPGEVMQAIGEVRELGARLVTSLGAASTGLGIVLEYGQDDDDPEPCRLGWVAVFLGDVISQVPLIDAALLKCYKGAPWPVAEALELEKSPARTLWLLPMTPVTAQGVAVRAQSHGDNETENEIRRALEVDIEVQTTNLRIFSNALEVASATGEVDTLTPAALRLVSELSGFIFAAQNLVNAVGLSEHIAQERATKAERGRRTQQVVRDGRLQSVPV